MIRDLIKRTLYRSGLMGLYHRVRNRNTLSVIMFHRVIGSRDPRFGICDPWYSMSEELFAEHLQFFRRHYNVVSAEQVLAAHAGKAPLPPRALLITFDDGWADNAEFALPQLKKHGMPALLFVVSDVVGRAEPFMQEMIINARRAGRLTAEISAGMWRDAGGADANMPPFASDTGLGATRDLIAQIEKLSPSGQIELVSKYVQRIWDSTVAMVTADQLRELHRNGVTIGSHGKTHTPLVFAEDLDAELTESRNRIGELLAAPAPLTLSFPHGRYTPEIAELARAKGYQLIFTSHEHINALDNGMTHMLGRMGASGEYCTDAAGRLVPEKLATVYFMREKVAA